MDINLLRKRLQEIRDSIAAGTMPAVPGFEVPSQPAAPSPVDTYNPPETVVPTTQPTATPISTNTPTNTQTPKTTQPTTPVTTPTTPTTPATTAAKNTAIPSSAKNSSQAPADPMSGEAGAKTMKAIQASDPMVYIKKNKFLAEAYNAGFYGTDITREARDNARAGGYLEQIEAMINAGKQDSKGSSTAEKTEKSDNGLSTEAARNEQIRMQNIKQAQNLAHTSDDLGDLTTEGALKEKLLQKNIDNIGKPVYNPDNTTGDNDSNIQYPSGSKEQQEKWDQYYQAAKTAYNNNPGEFFNPCPSGEFNSKRGFHGGGGYDFYADEGTPLYAIADGNVTIYTNTYTSHYNKDNPKQENYTEDKYFSYGVNVTLRFSYNGHQYEIVYAHLSPDYMNKYFNLNLPLLNNPVLDSSGHAIKDEHAPSAPNYNKVTTFNVKAGDFVGFVGSTGYSTGYHLHFTVIIDGKKVENPQQYFSGWGK